MFNPQPGERVANMDRTRKLDFLAAHRARLIEQINHDGNAAVLSLRLSCVEEEFRKEKAKQNSLFEKMRRVIEQVLEP